MSAAEARSARFRDDIAATLRNGDERPGAPGASIDERIRTAIFTGLLRPGDRLPSFRELADTCGVSRRATSKAYAALRDAQLVEARPRSGVYVRRIGPPVPEPGPETARWLVDVLAAAYEEHRIKIPDLPDLIRRWTASVPLLVACADAVEDVRVALASEIREHFGLAPTSLSPEEAASPGSLGSAELIVTTSFHAGPLRRTAAELNKELVVATMNPRTVAAVEDRLRAGRELTVVCLDVGFGRRLRLIDGGRYASAVRIVPADDGDAVAALDRATPILITRAAQRRLGARADFRLVAPPSPLFSPDFTRAVLAHVVRRNLAPRAS